MLMVSSGHRLILINLLTYLLTYFQRYCISCRILKDCGRWKLCGVEDTRHHMSFCSNFRQQFFYQSNVSSVDMFLFSAEIGMVMSAEMEAGWKSAFTEI